jgi:para-nitrobenzyl esterase
MEDEEVVKRIYKAYEPYGKRGKAIMFSDFSFRLPAIWFAEAQSIHGDTWMYRFDYETFGMRITGLHSFHSSDVPFLFGNFNEGLARYMVLLSPINRVIQRVHHEFRGDFLTFIKTGELPWEKCMGKDSPAKCYSYNTHIEQAVPDAVKQAFETSEYKRRSFSGEGLDL